MNFPVFLVSVWNCLIKPSWFFFRFLISSSTSFINLCDIRNFFSPCCALNYAAHRLTSILPVTACPEMHSSGIHLRRVIQPTRSVLYTDMASSLVVTAGGFPLSPVLRKCLMSFHDKIAMRPQKNVIKLQRKRNIPSALSLCIVFKNSIYLSISASPTQ